MMAVVVKNSQADEAELICGVSSDCVMLEPAKLEPEPVRFISVQNGVFETASNLTDLYNCSSEPTYQQLTAYQPFSNNHSQLGSEQEVSQTQEVYAGTDEFAVDQAERANTEISEHSSSTLSVPVQDYYEIQVAEEEVVSDNWNVDHTEVVVENCKPAGAKEERGGGGGVVVGDDIEIPLPENQDMYSHLHPYPCDFCSRRFSQKSVLMSHMISHQTERPHGCNLCGARYRRKNDLVNHMKIHALPPARASLGDESDDLRGGGDHAKNRRKKAQSLAPKKNSFSSEFGDLLEFKEDKKAGKNRFMKKGHKSLPGKMKSHIDDDLRLLAEMSRNSELLNQEPRWPVIDQSRPYVCQHCGVGFAREKALVSHSRIHGGDSPHECEICGEMFWSSVLMREHRRSKHPHLESSPAPATDPGTPNDEYAGDDRFGTFFCETCGISFYRLDLLQKHRRCHFKIEDPMQDVGDDDHVCMVCGQFFENASELRVHTETHLDHETYRCAQCAVKFDDQAELSEHVRSAHGDNAQDNTCALCGKVCKDRRALAKHACMQAENRSFPCYSCNKRFHSRARLRRHMVSHRDKAVSCSDCGEEFPDGRALMSHRHSHNANNHPARSFPCHDCGKTFGSRSSQQIHVRIHTGERPYGCHYCWKAFADGGTLRKHERIHTGEKPYVCPVCPKAFNQRVVLREHIRAHHSGSDSKVNSCYECKVCGYLFSSSSELCVHLVQHSDENTAKHRLPSMGPRKYKRRRKLGVPSPTKAPPSPPQDFESTDSSDSMIESKPVKKISSKKKFTFDSPSPPTRDLERSVVESFESVIDNIQSIVKSEPKKSKIDKMLMKKHKTKALSKLTKLARIEKRAKAAKLLNNTSYASKYVVSRPDDKQLDPQNRPRTKNVTYPTLEDSLETILNGSDAYRNRPRTKNVNYHNMNVKPTKLEPATFPIKGSKNKKPRAKQNFVKKEKSKYSPSKILNGSNPYDLEDNSFVSEEKLETCIVDDFNIEGVHAEVKPEDMPLMMEQKMESVMIKSEILTCEMCGDGFADRSELLAHIRVHI